MAIPYIVRIFSPVCNGLILGCKCLTLFSLPITIAVHSIEWDDIHMLPFSSGIKINVNTLSYIYMIMPRNRAMQCPHFNYNEWHKNNANLLSYLFESNLVFDMEHRSIQNSWWQYTECRIQIWWSNTQNHCSVSTGNTKEYWCFQACITDNICIEK